VAPENYRYLFINPKDSKIEFIKKKAEKKEPPNIGRKVA